MHRPQRPAGSTHSSTRGLRPPEQLERLGTGAFARVKIGVGKDRGNVVGHVLGKFDPETRKTMDAVVEAAAKAAAAVVKDGPDAAMNVWNGWSPGK